MVLETDKNRLDGKGEITLDEAQQKELKKTIKCGIYKELYKREILSDIQLNILLERNS